MDVDAVAQARGNVFSHKICLDRQFAVAAIDQDGQLDLGRAAEVIESVECGASRSAAEEDVIDEDNSLVCDVEGDVGGMDVRGGVLSACNEADRRNSLVTTGKTAAST